MPERSRRRCTFEVEDLLGDDAQTAEQLTAPGGSAAFEVREKVRVRMRVRVRLVSLGSPTLGIGSGSG